MWNPRFNDPEDPEKPNRFIWYYKGFDDEYVLWDRETNVEVLLPSQYIKEQQRLPHETDTQFIIRLVKELLTFKQMKQLPPPT
jgi:hypothetical protein